MIRKNDTVTGTVSGYTAEGAGVVKIDSYPIFVPFSAEGDEGEGASFDIGGHAHGIYDILEPVKASGFYKFRYKYVY